MIPTSLRAVLIVAGNELADSIRSRRVLVMVFLYLAGSVAATLIFLHVLHGIEGQLVETLGLSASGKTGGVTATLWKSNTFRQIMISLIGDKDLTQRLLSIPPLGLFYAWLSFAFAPFLVMLTSASRVSESCPPDPFATSVSGCRACSGFSGSLSGSPFNFWVPCY